ncbi:MAG: TIGR00266 family protein [Patescibacteria group bacterium]
MADKIDYEIIGEDLQAVTITLDPGEGVRAEIGSMLYMENGIDMQTNVDGGLLKGFKRMFTGESFFISNYINKDTVRRGVAFAAPYPGKLMPVDLAQFNGQLICQKDSFLCAASGVDIDIAFTKKLGAGLFGGEGFILQKLSGTGLAIVHIGGTLLTKQLQAGEQLRVDTGCLAAFTKDVQYDIKFIGGFKNVLFGGEGMFYTVLTGPGTVFLQSLPFARIADRINAHSVKNDGTTKRVGGILGDIISGQ